MEHPPFEQKRFNLRSLSPALRNLCLLLVITHAPQVCSQLSSGLLLRMDGLHRTQFDHARLDLLSRVI